MLGLKSEEINEEAIVELAEDVANNEKDIAAIEEGVAELGNIAEDVDCIEEAIMELGDLVSKSDKETSLIAEVIHSLTAANRTMTKGLTRLIGLQFALFGLVVVMMVVLAFFK